MDVGQQPKVVSRRAWHVGSNEEEARTYLQSRLVVFSRLMFWSFVGLLAFLSLMYTLYPSITPARNREIFAGSAVGVGLLAVIWRVFLVRRRLSLKTLNGIDAFYACGTGTVFGIAAFLAADLKPAPYACLLYATFMVLTRAIIVPSSGRRTAVLSAIGFIPMVLAAAAIGVQYIEYDLPTPALICGTALVCLVVVLLASAGSQVTYGLRLDVSEAMQLGQYTLDRKIGQGGMGTVYRAHHAMLRRPTAVKLVHPEHMKADTLDRFEREVQHMSELTHPNTVAVFDYGRNPDGVFYYAMEYLGGIDLEELVHRFGPQPVARTVSILTQVCGALQEAHETGIIHRDIKPANIILCERGRMPDIAKVVDFGLVKEIAGDTGSSMQVVLGTPAYIAPEAVTDPDHIGPPADLYSLGAVGYFLLTGKRLFEGKTAVDVCIQHVTKAPLPPSQAASVRVPLQLEQLIMACLSKQPVDRPETAATLAHLLRALPIESDWSDAQARQWWATFREAEAASESASSTPTMTITVDVGRRA